MRPPIPLDERFKSRYTPIPESGCWIWEGALVDGYGAIDDEAGNGKRAHRVSWELQYGTIPQGAQVLHRCDIRCCVNPAHLFLGSNKDNIVDKVNKKRCAKGEVHSRAKLTNAQVRSIYTDTRPIKVIAEEHGVIYGTVYAIKHGYNWKHLKLKI